MSAPTAIDRMRSTLAERVLAGPDTPALLMVAGWSDSTALAYLAAESHEAGELGPLAMLHVNHQLRGEEADGAGPPADRDEAFHVRAGILRPYKYR